MPTSKQSPVQPDQHGHRAEQEQHVADPGERRFRCHALDLADVVVDARHDVAQSRLRVVARRQTLQVLVQLAPHVEEDLRRHARVLEPAYDVEHEPNGPDDDEELDDARERGEIAPDERLVDERFGEVREPQREARARQAHREHDEEPPPIGNDVLGTPAGSRARPQCRAAPARAGGGKSSSRVMSPSSVIVRSSLKVVLS